MKKEACRIHTLLVRNRKTVSVAESCTGGLLSWLLTLLPGSSAYFVLGIVAYHNDAKQKILGIPRAVIARRGAVSRETALLMARRVRKISGADFGIGVTGIAGPGGAVKGKPAGTVFIAVAGDSGSECRKFLFEGSRETVRRKSALQAAAMLERMLSRRKP